MKKNLHSISKVLFSAVLLTLFITNYTFAQCDKQALQQALDVMAGDAEVSVTTVDNTTNALLNGWEAPRYYYELSPAAETPSFGSCGGSR